MLSYVLVNMLTLCGFHVCRAGEDGIKLMENYGNMSAEVRRSSCCPYTSDRYEGMTS